MTSNALDPQLLQRALDILQRGLPIEIRDLAYSLYPAQSALLLQYLNHEQRVQYWSIVPPSVMGEILIELDVAIAEELLSVTDRKDLIAACENLTSESAVDLLHVLPEPLLSQVMEAIGVHNRQRAERQHAFEPHTAGSLMTSDVLTIRADVTLDVVSRYLRLRRRLPDAFDSLVVIDRQDHYLGVLRLSQLLSHDPHTRVSSVMDNRFPALSYRTHARDIAARFNQNHILSVPVVSDDNRVIGWINADTVLSIVRDEADHSLMGMAGLLEEHDIFSPAMVSAKRRTVWLGINLLTAFLAAWVIDWFEHTIQQLVALAVLMPIVASMGGIAGSQTLTLVIRGLALRQINSGNTLGLLWKELSVGVVNGLVWSVVVTFVGTFWFHDFHLGLLLGSAMLINLICAALSGVTIPVVLDKIGVDPALAGGVLLTTVTDVVGFMAFLGLATLFLV